MSRRIEVFWHFQAEIIFLIDKMIVLLYRVPEVLHEQQMKNLRKQVSHVQYFVTYCTLFL